jgi:hypothetical protein
VRHRRGCGKGKVCWYKCLHLKNRDFLNNETKSWFSEKSNKIKKSFLNMTKQRREKTQINKIRDEKGDIKTPENHYRVL